MSHLPSVTSGITVGHGHAGLVEASGGSRFVHHDVALPAGSTWYAVNGAVAFPRATHSGGISWTVLGGRDGVTRLLGRLADPGVIVGRTLSITLPRQLEPLLHHRFRLGAGSSWEWLWTTEAPLVPPRSDLLQKLGAAELEEIAAFLADHFPQAIHHRVTDAEWFALRLRDGSLGAVGAYSAAQGAGYLSSLAVSAHLRGRGLGRLLTAYLTDRGVREQGLCTLAVYSDNEVARSLYTSLGYKTEWQLASRAVVCLR